MAGAGDGGGIKVLWSLAADQVRISSNLIVNNVSGLAGAGIALQDAADVDILHNTVAHNDSTATAGVAFATANQSTPQPAGIAVRVSTGSAFTAPRLDSNIIWQNRSYYFQIASPTVFGLVLNTAAPATSNGYWDLGVLPAAAGNLATAANLALTS